jgi:hypothetical protein
LAAFLLFAQRFFCASEILVRASGDKLRFGVELVAGAFLREVVLPAGRPGFRLAIELLPFRSALASCKRENFSIDCDHYVVRIHAASRTEDNPLKSLMPIGIYLL